MVGCPCAVTSSTFGAHCQYEDCRCIDSLICNWLSGLLNNLARAIRPWTGKKSRAWRREPGDEVSVPEYGVRTVRRDRGFKWGDHFITPVGTMTTLTRSHVAFLATTLLESAPKSVRSSLGETKCFCALSIGPAWGQLAQTFTLEALGFNCDTGASGLHVLRCLLRLATLSEHFPHLGTGINAWEKIERNSRVLGTTGLAVGIPSRT